MLELEQKTIDTLDRIKTGFKAVYGFAPNDNEVVQYLINCIPGEDIQNFALEVNEK